MLSNRVPIRRVTGILVLRAESVREGSNESFILRIFRRENKTGFIKALSERAEPFVTGFSKLANAMKCLSLREVVIWPRFHLTVCENLDTVPIDVTEVRQPLTGHMLRCQIAILGCIEAVVNDLKRSHPSVDVDDLTPVSAITRSFDAVIKVQLGPVWHRLPYRSKQLINDIKILRKLLAYLLTYDCVSFYMFLEILLAASNAFAKSGYSTREQSPWLYLDAANDLFSAARSRVYRRKADRRTIVPVLEENPKWRLCYEVLEEIEGPGVVLVMVKDRGTASQLEEYLLQASLGKADRSPMMLKLLDRYVSWKGNLTVVQSNLKDGGDNPLFGDTGADLGRGRPCKRRRIRGGTSNVSTGDGNPLRRPGDSLQYWSAQLEKEAIELSGNESRSGINAASTSGGGAITIKAVRGAPTTNGPRTEDTTLADVETAVTSNTVNVTNGKIQTDPNAFHAGQYELLRTTEAAGLTLMICPYDEADDDLLLSRSDPTHVVLYDPEPGFVRRLEVHHALRVEMGGASNMKVQFFMYDNSAEEQLYLNAIRKEKEAFEKVIKEKGSMALAIDEGQEEEEALERALQNRETRLAGGQSLRIEDPLVVIDMREFRSSLPSILHARRFRVVPCTLEVGDYVLSPDVVVERKSTQDLIQSIASGRLFSQVEAMTTFYEQAILLIEFESPKAFGFGDWSTSTESSVQSKLALLTLHFPKLRIIWSTSPHATVEIFEDLKQNRPEPTAEDARLVGLDAEQADLVYSLAPQEVLRSIPGVVAMNCRVLMSRYRNLQDLCEESEGRLKAVIGPERAKTMLSFMSRDVRKAGNG